MTRSHDLESGPEDGGPTTTLLTCLVYTLILTEGCSKTLSLGRDPNWREWRRSVVEVGGRDRRRPRGRDGGGSSVLFLTGTGQLPTVEVSKGLSVVVRGVPVERTATGERV